MRTIRSRLAVAAVLGVLAMSSLGAQGVTTGGIGGTVTDPSNNPLPNAQIQITNKLTGATAGATTRENGRYYIQGLEVGDEYTVVARRIGFAPQTRDFVVVRLSVTTRIDFKLTEQAAVISAVTVTATNDGFESSNTGTKGAVGDTVLQRLPTQNRQLTDFIKLIPQVSASGPGYSAGGMSNRMNNVQIDGATERDVFGLGSTGQPGGQINAKSVSIEAVKEFQVLLAPFDVRQGNFGGLLLNAVTKGGTNEFHGSVFYDYRNQNWGRDTPVLRATDFNRTNMALSFGGPIIKDKMHFFVADELKSENVPLFGPYVGQPANATSPLQIAQADFTRFEQIMAGAPYNHTQIGTNGIVNGGRPQHNPFVRIDYKVNDSHRLVARVNYGTAEQQYRTQNNRSSSVMVYTDNEHIITSKKLAPVLQLYSNFANGSSNELFVGYNRVRDRRTPYSTYPQVTVTVPRVGGGNATIITGADQFSQGNELDVDTYELTDNWSKNYGAHTITFGTRNEYVSLRNLFTQSSYGIWSFRSLDSLAAGNANSFRKAVILRDNGNAYFKSINSAWYAQDQWAATPRLTLTMGLRADVASFLTKIPYSAAVDSAYGRRTDDIPTTSIQWSPRIGFNWDIDGDARRQLRGGVGLFVGTPPGVWLENPVVNSGSLISFLNCNTSGSTSPAPAFNVNPNTYSVCRNGQGSAPIGQVDFLDPDLKYPQPLRFSLAYDRRIGDDLVATVEGLYGRTLNQLFMVNKALTDPRGVDPHGRVLYGDSVLTNNGASRSKVPAGILNNGGTARFGGAYEMTNQNNDYFYNLTFQLQKRYSRNWQGVVAYTYGRSYDVQSFTSSTANSNWRFGRTLSTDQTKADRAVSLFDQPHNVVAQGTYTHHWWKDRLSTDFTLFYRGSSGSAHDYVYGGSSGAGDLNVDGNQGNDLLYVPLNAFDTNEIQFRTSGSVTIAQQQQAFEDFIKSSPCLSKQRGQIMKRNSCRVPWQDQMDLTIRQSLPEAFGGQRATFIFQIYNVMNLINDKWGKTYQTDGTTNSNVPLLTHVGMTSIDPKVAVPIFTHNINQKTYIKGNGTGDNYQFQAGFRYSW